MALLSYFDLISRLAYRATELMLSSIAMGLILISLLALIWRFARGTSAATRYATWWGLLPLLLAMPLMLQLGASFPEPFEVQAGRTIHSDARETGVKAPAPGSTPTTKPSAPSNQVTGGSQATREATASAMESRSLLTLALGMLPISLAAILPLISATLLIRILISHRRLALLKQECRPLRDEQLLAFVTANSPGRIPRLGLSSAVAGPQLAGLRDPVILFPPELLDEMTKAELEMTLRHELAHIGRRDDYTKLAQKLIEALFFFNPAILLLGRQLDLERELACDEMVIEDTHRPADYCRCLTRLAELTASLPGKPLPGTLGVQHQIFTRFRRLLCRDRSMRACLSRPRMLGVLGVVIILPAFLIPFTPILPLPAAAVSLADFRDRKEEPASEVLLKPPPPGRQLNWRSKIYNLGLSFTLNEPDGVKSLETILQLTKDDKLTVVLHGDVELDIARSRVVKLGKDSFVAIRDQRSRKREVDIHYDEAGKLVHDYFVRGKPKEFDGNARTWLDGILLKTARNIDEMMPMRIDRIMHEVGLPGMLAELDEFESDSQRSFYYKHLLREMELDSVDFDRTLATAMRQIQSDDNRGDLLAAITAYAAADTERFEIYLAALENLSPKRFEFGYYFRDFLKSAMRNAEDEAQVARGYLRYGRHLNEHMKARLIQELLPYCRADKELLDRCDELRETIDSAYERQSLGKQINEARSL